jgi:aquaporin Z
MAKPERQRRAAATRVSRLVMPWTEEAGWCAVYDRSGPKTADVGAQDAEAVERYAGSRIAAIFEDFRDPRQEWRRLFSEFLGTFFLVLVAAGGGMMGQAFPNTISRTAAVVAPGLMVLAIILFMGKVSGAHLNPAVSIAFALRGDFPWQRVPGYIVIQLAGAAAAAWFLQALVNVSASFGSNYPASSYSSTDAFLMETILTLGLVSVILGTASGAQFLGVFGALGVGGYIALAGLWGSPISGTSMNPARTFGPDLVGADFTAYWVYIAGPLLGAAIAVGFAFILRGRGGGLAGSAAAQGALFTAAENPDQR